MVHRTSRGHWWGPLIVLFLFGLCDDVLPEDFILEDCILEDCFLEDFDEIPISGLVFPGGGGPCAAPGSGTNCAFVDDLAGAAGGPGAGRLVLTRGQPGEGGFAWFSVPVDLSVAGIVVEVDVFLAASAGSAGDGIAVILQPGGDTEAMGGGGGSLGIRGLAPDSIAVALDIHDNGDVDPETPCDGPGTRTCHVEVHQGGDPEKDAPIAYGTDLPDLVELGSAGEPVRLTVTLDGREIAVTVDAQTRDFGKREAIRTLLPRAPAGQYILGLAGTSGAGAAVQSVDNLRVAVAPVAQPVIAWAEPVDRGGINCGGEEILAEIGGIPARIAGDGAYGEIQAVIAGRPSLFVVRSAGRVATGDEGHSTFDGPVEGVEDAALEPLYSSEAWSRLEVVYRHHVVPGRYAITLHFAENRAWGLDPAGRPTRRYDIRVQGQDALLAFGPAEAAGADRGGCTALSRAAVTRRFLADAVPFDEAVSGIEVRAKDLGGGSPPDDAQLNGVTFERIGDPTGEPLAGDIEDHRLPRVATFGAPRETFHLDFDLAIDGTGAGLWLGDQASVSAGRFFQPLIRDGRLRIADDRGLLSAVSVLLHGGGSGVFDPRATRLDATFDVFLSDGSALPADGLVFGILAGGGDPQMGGPGGSLGFGGIGTSAVGVEIDLWKGGGFGDATGFNDGGRGHLAVVGSGASPATVDHVQSDEEFSPDLSGEEWPDLLSPAGYRMEVSWYPEGRVEAFLAALDGSFPRRQVLGTWVTPFRAETAVAGFFAATGSEAATMEIDNVIVELRPCDSAPEVARISPAGPIVLALEGGESAALDLDGTSSAPGAGDALTFQWSIEAPPEGAATVEGCGPNVRGIFLAPGEYRIRLAVDDRHCGSGSAATVAVSVVDEIPGPRLIRGDTNADGSLDISDPVIVLDELLLGVPGIRCGDAADVNDDGKLDISDPVSVLVFLFLGGSPPAHPFPECGRDPTPDRLDCARASAPCR